MAISFIPKAGNVLRCNFAGMRTPEMVKIRPVMIINPKLPYRSELVTLVPLSGTPPIHNLPFTVRLSRNYYPGGNYDAPQWAKCDMIYNLRIDRLDRFPLKGRGWEYVTATADDLEAVHRGVLAGLGYSALQIEQIRAT